MNANSPSEKRTALPGWILSIFVLLRMFWLFELALLIVVVYGQNKGWSTPRQWSDAFFVSGVIQIVIGGYSSMNPPSEALDAGSLRYLPNSDISDTRRELAAGRLRLRNFGLRAFIGGVLTILIAAVVLWV